QFKSSVKCRGLGNEGARGRTQEPGSLVRFLLPLFAGTAIGVLVSVPSARTGEEAYRTDGHRVAGSLTLGEDGSLRFTPAGQGGPVPSADLARVRFPAGRPAVFRVGGGHRIHLHDGQHLTGELLALEDEVVVLRTAWAERLNIPRAGIVGITPLPGWRTVFADDL